MIAADELLAWRKQGCTCREFIGGELKIEEDCPLHTRAVPLHAPEPVEGPKTVAEWLEELGLALSRDPSDEGHGFAARVLQRVAGQLRLIGDAPMPGVPDKVGALLTPAERALIEKLGACFNDFRKLEHLHQADIPEFVFYTHGLQCLLLSRAGARLLRTK